MLKADKPSLPLSVSLIVSERYGKPCLEVRRVLTDMEIIKSIVACAFQSQPIIILPTFSDQMRALGALVDKGIIYRNKENKQFYFTF